MRERLEDVVSYLYRERDHYSKQFDGERVRLLTGYINTLNALLREVKDDTGKTARDQDDDI